MTDVSICIPVYNAAKYLDTLLQSVLQQGGVDFEVIAIDDGSNDSSWSILDRYRRTDPRLNIMQQKNSGAAQTRNRCVATARSPLFLFIDADDYLFPGSLRAAVRQARSHPDHVVAMPWIKFKGVPPQKATPDAESLQPDSSGTEWILHRWLRTTSCTYTGSLLLPASIVRSQCWDRNLTVMDDMPYMTAAIVRSSGVVMARDALFGYRQPESGHLSMEQGRNSAESSYRAVSEAVKAILSMEDSHRVRTACSNQLMLFSYAHYLDHEDVAEEAARWAIELATPSIAPLGGRLRRALCSVLGWRQGLRLHRKLRNLW